MGPGMRRAGWRAAFPDPATLSGWRADMAALLCGALAALALPPLFLVPLLWIAIPGLLGLIEGARGSGGAFRRGFLFGFAHHLIGLYWVTNAVLVEAAEFWWAVPLAVPALAAVLALFIAIPCAIARRVPGRGGQALALAGLWVLGDLARQFALTGFPWNPLGSVWEFPGFLGLAMMQPAAWMGVQGLTLGTLLVAAIPALPGLGRALAAAMLLVWGVAGAVRLADHRAGPPPGLTAVIVQGDVSEIAHRDHWQDQGWALGVFERYLQLTRQGMARAGGRRALVLWPETASPFWLEQDAPARAAIAAAAHGAAASLVGAPRSNGRGGGYNSLIALGPDGTVVGHYDKHHLVPFGEYFPDYLPIRLGEQGWSAGPGLVTLHLPGLPAIGPLICYEAAFPGQVAVEQDRPAMLVNLTNDAWFGNSSGPRQHLAAARLRAIEEGLPMLRAANTGISAVIDAHGRVTAELGLDRTGALVAPVPGALPPTPFSRMGLAAPLMLGLLATALGAGLSARPQTRAFGD